MTRRLPRGLIIKKLEQRFRKLNPKEDWDNVNLDSITYPCDYMKALLDTANANPHFKWYDDSDPLHLDPQKPWPSDEDVERARFEEEAERNRNSVRIELKLYFQKSKKGEDYAYVKGTIAKKVLRAFRTRLCEELVVDWPIIGTITEDEYQARYGSEEEQDPFDTVPQELAEKWEIEYEEQRRRDNLGSEQPVT